MAICRCKLSAVARAHVLWPQQAVLCSLFVYNCYIVTDCKCAEDICNQVAQQLCEPSLDIFIVQEYFRNLELKCSKIRLPQYKNSSDQFAMASAHLQDHWGAIAVCACTGICYELKPDSTIILSMHLQILLRKAKQVLLRSRPCILSYTTPMHGLPLVCQSWKTQQGGGIPHRSAMMRHHHIGYIFGRAYVHMKYMSTSPISSSMQLMARHCGTTRKKRWTLR